MSLLGPACVKTRTSGEGAELFSPFASFDGDCQCCCFSIQRNLDKISTRKFDCRSFHTGRVKNGRDALEMRLPLYRHERTLPATAVMSVECHEPTHAPQQ